MEPSWKLLRTPPRRRNSPRSGESTPTIEPSSPRCDDATSPRSSLVSPRSEASADIYAPVMIKTTPDPGTRKRQRSVEKSRQDQFKRLTSHEAITWENTKSDWKTNGTSYLARWSILCIAILVTSDLLSNHSKIRESQTLTTMQGFPLLRDLGRLKSNDNLTFTQNKCFSVAINDEAQRQAIIKQQRETHYPEGCPNAHHHPNVPPKLIFIFMTLLFGCLLRILVEHIALPYTVVLMIAGITTHYLIKVTDCHFPCANYESYFAISRIEFIDKHTMLGIFLPVLLFESAYDMDLNLLKRQLFSIIVMAVPGLLIASMASGLIFYHTIPHIKALDDGIDPEQLDVNTLSIKPSWGMAFAFGALISATDPVAVVALLKELGGSKSLGTLIEGEALFNDGCAIILFSFMLQVSKLDLISQNDQLYYGLGDGGAAAGHGEAASHMANFLTYYSADAVQESNTTVVAKELPIMTTVLIMVWDKVILSTLVGFACAAMTSRMLVNIFADMLLEVSIPLIMCYLSYYVAETVIDGSGVIACVIFGFRLDRNSICPANHEFLHKFFHMLGYLANTLIFFMVGVIIVDVVNTPPQITGGKKCDTGANDWGIGMKLVMSVFLYITLSIVRLISTFVVQPLMKQKAKQFDVTYKEVFVMTWGGLRGAVSLCLALGLLANKNPGCSPYKSAANDILFITTIIVMLTLVVNATTIKKLMTYLGMLEITTSMHATMSVAVFHLRELTAKNMSTYRYDPFLSDAYWPLVGQKTLLAYPYGVEPKLEQLLAEDNAMRMSKTRTSTVEQSITDNFIERGLKSLKMIYSKQFAEGTIDEEVFEVLERGITRAMAEERFVQTNDIQKYWQIGGIFPKIKKRIESLMFDNRKKKAVCPWKNRFMRKWYTFAKRPGFDYFMQLVVFMNMPVIYYDLQLPESIPCHYDPGYLELSKEDASLGEAQICMIQASNDYTCTFTHDDTTTHCLKSASTRTYEWTMIMLLNVVFVIIYLIEFIVKFFGLGRKQYVADYWNLFDLFVLITGLLDLLIILATVTGTSNASGGSTSLDNFLKAFKSFKLLKASKMVKMLKFLRALRALKFLRTIVPETVKYCDKKIHESLSEGYAIGRCFIRGQEELVKVLPSICDNRKILDKYREEAEGSRLMAVRELGLLQRDQPGLAISIKTKQAVRTLLNSQREQVQKYQSGGVLDEHECGLLVTGIEKNMKDMRYGFPLHVEPPADLEMVDNIPWIDRSNRELRNFFRSRAERMDFDCGDILIQEGEEVDGIYLVTSGMVKVSGSGMNPDQEHVEVAMGTDHATQDKTIYSNQNKFDYICSGGLVGEIGCLVKRGSQLTAECETAVTAYLMKVEDVDLAMDMFAHLRQDIWRSYAITVAMTCEVLDMGSTSEQQRQYLQPAYLKEMGAKEAFVFDESSQAVVVVHGQVRVTYKVNLRFRDHRQFQPHIVNAPGVIKPAFDPNYKAIEQTVAPMSNIDAENLPKLLIVPNEISGDDCGTVEMVERMTQAAPMLRPIGQLGLGSSRNTQRGSAFKPQQPPTGATGILSNNAVRPAFVFEE